MSEFVEEELLAILERQGADPDIESTGVMSPEEMRVFVAVQMLIKHYPDKHDSKIVEVLGWAKSPALRHYIKLFVEEKTHGV